MAYKYGIFVQEDIYIYSILSFFVSREYEMLWCSDRAREKMEES